jgi:hypothetical protein
MFGRSARGIDGCPRFSMFCFCGGQIAHMKSCALLP